MENSSVKVFIVFVVWWWWW